MPVDNFIHLHTHSAYSLAEGAMQINDLVGLCKAEKMAAVAVTDSGNLFGALEFAQAAAKKGVQPIIGCEVRLGLENHELVLLVQDQAGYRNICALISRSFLDGDPMRQAHVTWEQLAAHAAGLLCLTGGVRGPVAQYLLHNQDKAAAETLRRLKKIFSGRLYVEIQRHGLPEEDASEERLIDLAYKHDLPLVATNNCYFAAREMHEAHDALLCIAGGRYVTEDSRRRETPDHYFKSAEEMRALFADLPEAADNTLVIAHRCGFLLKGEEPILPRFPTAAGRTEADELHAQATAGLEWRLENFIYATDAAGETKDTVAIPYKQRLGYELAVITQMGFPGYFLIVSDFIRWAKEQGIPVGPGRGSGAGSVVAWALQITDLDPLKFDLLFERFLNPERVSMPDFDIDFCQERRDEVIRYVQQRYGEDRVAQIITFGKLQARAVLRDVGRVLQLPYGQVDRICKQIPNNPAAPVTLAEALARDDELRAAIARDEGTQKMVDIALKLEGLYRHASTHAAGVVISDRPLQELIPLYRDPRSAMPVTQFNMKYTEAAGLVKFDFLGLKTMTVVQKTVEMIRERGVELDMLKVPLDDAATYAMLAEGHATGVFQLESSGMKDTLRRMKPDRFGDIVALVSLYRPGPMDNIPLYCDIKDGRAAPDYMHPKLQPLLEETYGIMIYQEQVMQAAQVLAGYTLGGADLLRRAMGKKIKAEMDAQRERFVEGAAATNNVPEAQAVHIFEQIEKFAGYGFNKSHAAAYALISYWTAWLKTNYPVEFMAASMALDVGNTDKLAVFKQELDRMGIRLLPPDVNRSGANFTVEYGAGKLILENKEPGAAVRYALAALKGVGEEAMRSLIAERRKNGLFKSLQDLAERLPGVLNKRQLENLAGAGAFDGLEPNRARAQFAAETLLRHGQAIAAERNAGQVSLFGDAAPMPALDLPAAENWDPLEKLRHEFDAAGFYLSAHPLDSKAAQLARLNVVPVAEAAERVAAQGVAVMYMAGVLMKKQFKVSAKSGNKYAFLQLSDASGVYEVTLFSETLHAARDFLIEGESLLLKVAAEQREDQIRYTAQSVAPLDKTLAGKVREIKIHLAATDALPTLKTLLDDHGRGQARISLYINGDNSRTELRLPDQWNLPAAAQSKLLKMPGVLSINEF